MTGSRHLDRHAYMYEADPVRWLRRIFGLLVLLLALQVFNTWQNHTIRVALEAMEQKMPSQKTIVPITVNGTATTTEVTTDFREEGYETETKDEWDDRHIAECQRIKTAWAQTQ